MKTLWNYFSSAFRWYKDVNFIDFLLIRNLIKWWYGTRSSYVETMLFWTIMAWIQSTTSLTMVLDSSEFTKQHYYECLVIVKPVKCAWALIFLFLSLFFFRGNKNVSLYLSWNVIPNAGVLPLISQPNKFFFDFPNEYTVNRGGFDHWCFCQSQSLENVHL